MEEQCNKESHENITTISCQGDGQEQRRKYTTNEKLEARSHACTSQALYFYKITTEQPPKKNAYIVRPYKFVVDNHTLNVRPIDISTNLFICVYQMHIFGLQ